MAECSVAGGHAVNRALLALTSAALALAAPAYAHHSFAATYFEDQRVTVQGSLVEFDFRNPHAIVRIATADEQGNAVEYSAEWAAATRLQSQGVTKETLKAGDYIVIIGAPHRDAGQRRLHLRSIERPADGWKWGGFGGPGPGRGPGRGFGRR
jgi:hypothetical protein